jgi:hypothetical protein
MCIMLHANMPCLGWSIVQHKGYTCVLGNNYSFSLGSVWRRGTLYHCMVGCWNAQYRTKKWILFDDQLTNEVGLDVDRCYVL